ncbi:lipoyl(octanoyl) transferase [Niastella koreensis]|uniref:Octanoyltransferase n=2 Tax=Niastella koreensis TaxID=354356 RepID=G8TI72_NIAKG|nr:lipoyl(octanoyl) transferase LipB [Niastella koreensis]AEW00689.1 Octanoyltransferase [Niastella koreensis GR20-10]OQP42319.1 lipoyl(octanoyl) transferase [Niastella koreensis]
METSNKQAVLFRDLGNMEYQHAWDLQEKLLKENVEVKTLIRNRNMALEAIGNGQLVIDNEEVTPSTTNYLLFVEHPPVYTLGKSGDMSNVLISEEERAAQGISFYNTNRGGDITFHGKDQLVGYPILDLDKFYTDLGRYLRSLEEVIILTMAEYGLKGERSPGETGVWLDASIPGKERKICAMGIRCSRWITMHGFAFNINTDLNYFNYIIPCGIQNKQVTSLERELGRKLDMDEVKERVKKNFEKVFAVELTGA